MLELRQRALCALQPSVSLSNTIFPCPGNSHTKNGCRTKFMANLKRGRRKKFKTGWEQNKGNPQLESKVPLKELKCYKATRKTTFKRL